MKIICKKIEISKILLLIIFLSFISGLFKDILCFLSIIVIHELGHIIFSKIYNWKIDKITFGLYGGYITYDDVIDKPFKEDILISIAGFLFQSIYFFIIYILYINAIIDLKLFLMFKKYYLGILIFNMLPIIPLDGSKILSVILNYFFSYYNSLKYLFYISFATTITIIMLFLLHTIKLEYSYLIVFSFVLSNLFSYIKLIPYIFNKFLYERYIYPINSNKYIIIKKNDLKKMKRRKKHYFNINNHYYDERVILSKRFD